MKIERPQALVPWLPSRNRYALFRLLAYLRLARTTPQARDESRVLAIDRDQNSGEAFVMAALIWAVTWAFFAHLLASSIGVAAAFFIAGPAAILALNAAVVVIGIAITPVLHAIGLPRGPHNIATNSAVVLLVLTVASSYFATLPSWVAVPASLFLTAIVVNGVAALVMFALRHRVRLAEQRCVV